MVIVCSLKTTPESHTITIEVVAPVNSVFNVPFTTFVPPSSCDTEVPTAAATKVVASIATVYSFCSAVVNVPVAVPSAPKS